MLLNYGVGEDSWESVPWTAKRSNQSIPKEISPEHSLEGLMLKLKLQYFGYLMPRTDSFEKTQMLGKIKGGRRTGLRGWDAFGWHHWPDGYEFEQVPRFGDGQGSLLCCSPWGRKESEKMEWLNWTESLSLTLSMINWFSGGKNNVRESHKPNNPHFNREISPFFKKNWGKLVE